MRNEACYARWFFGFTLLFRFALGLRLILSGHLAAVVFGLVDAAVICINIRAASIGWVDWSLRGALAGLLYLAPLLFTPSGRGNPWFGALLIVLSVGQLAIRLRLSDCVTVGCPIFVRVIDRFPYNIVRHPLSLLEAAAVCIAFLCWPTVWNFSVAVLCVFAGAGTVILEEMHLSSIKRYRDYCRRVEWRWCPGFW